jgi:GNAT superfamily N-acetyltransferase
LLQLAFPNAAHVTREYLRWEYTRNPDGNALGFDAFDADRLVSHCVVQPLRARLFGKEVCGVLSLNAVTDPDYQGRGSYFELARRTYDLAREQGYAFGVAVTNDRSTSGFVSKVDFQVIRPLDVRVGVGTVAHRPLAAALDFEKLWSPEALAWRLASPTIPYRLGGNRDSLAVYAPSGRRGIAVQLADLPSDARPAVERAGVTAGATSPLRLWVGLDPDVAWGRSAYVPVPLALRPSPLNMIFLDLANRGRIPEPGRLRWRAIDFDDF